MNVQYLSKKDAKELSKAAIEIGFDFEPEKMIVIDKDSKVLIGNGIFILTENRILPFIADKRVDLLPEISVDEGAVKHIINGASVMRPGVTKIDERVKKDGIVKVTFENQVICIGFSLYDSSEMEKLEKGAVVKNVHRKGDKFWDTVSEYLATLKQKR
ncbi:MAG: PUA domain-containing protein [Nitrososphaeria archaeon]